MAGLVEGAGVPPANADRPRVVERRRWFGGHGDRDAGGWRHRRCELRRPREVEDRGPGPRLPELRVDLDAAQAGGVDADADALAPHRRRIREPDPAAGVGGQQEPG